MAAQLFLDKVQDKQEVTEREQRRFQKIVDEKTKILIPMRQLLKRMMDAGVVVTNQSIHDFGARTKNHAPQNLEVWEAESSPHWLPGTSLFLDHPAEIEIAVSNPNNKDKEGLVVIQCTTEHPSAYLLRGPFYNVADACQALALFLSASTVRVERPEEMTKP